MNLNNNETAMLTAVGNEIIDCTDGQFGYASDIDVGGISKAQKSGYIGQLVQKGLVSVDEEFDSIQLTAAGANLLVASGSFAGKSFETVDGGWVECPVVEQPAALERTQAEIDKARGYSVVSGFPVEPLEGGGEKDAVPVSIETRKAALATYNEARREYKNAEFAFANCPATSTQQVLTAKAAAYVTAAERWNAVREGK